MGHQCSTVRMDYALTVNGGSGPRTDVYEPPVCLTLRCFRVRHPLEVTTVCHSFHIKLNSSLFLSVLLQPGLAFLKFSSHLPIRYLPLSLS